MPDRPKTRKTVVLAALFSVVALSATLHFAFRQSLGPTICSEGTIPLDARCCAHGQTLDAGRCTGQPSSCPEGLRLDPDGCVAIPKVVRLPSGSLVLGPGDWEAQGIVQPRVVRVEEPFWIDAFEVTFDRYRQCVSETRCQPVGVADEPGRPVHHVAYSDGVAFCAWAKGSLPTEDQWLLAAAGTDARRYAWGDTGAVCRRACWGRWDGPCRSGGTGPDWAGVHPEDMTREGVFDLTANVSEWVTGGDGSPKIKGGSWRTRLASSLRTWHNQDPTQLASTQVGFRCAYSHQPDVLP